MKRAVDDFFEEGFFSRDQKRLCLSMVQKIAQCIKANIKAEEKRELEYSIETWHIFAKQKGGSRQDYLDTLCRFEQSDLYIKCKKSNDVNRCVIKKECARGTCIYKMPYAGRQRICDACMKAEHGDEYIVDWNL